jgi:hypothetical protein
MLRDVASITVCLVSLIAVLPAGACDPFPDEREPDDNVCEGNVANRCYRPGPESRLVTDRTDCGASRTCTISSAGEPICAERDLPKCDAAEARACHGASLATCRRSPGAFRGARCRLETMKKARAVLAAIVMLGAACRPTTSAACLNEVLRTLTPVEEIAAAEKDLEHGRLAEAAHRVRARYPGIRSLGPSAPPLAQRALRIYALVLVRADGRFDSQLGWARSGNLEWALETLAELERARPNDVRSQADLAEARTRLARTRSEGVRVLEDLDRRDLLGSPFSYLALARARRASNDAPGAAAALRRCSMMSVERRLCATDLAGEPTRDRG